MSGLSFRPRPIDIFKKLPIIRVDIPNDEISIPKPASQPVQPEKPRSEIPVPKFVNVEYYDRLRAHINFARGPSYYRCPVDRTDKRDDKVDYDLDSDDERFLQNLNDSKKLLDEDKFERMIDKLENLSGALGYDKMIDEKPFRQAFPHARELVLARVYEHWKQKREKRGGKALDRRFQAPPSADDTRPDVAFRPREIKARPVQKKQQKERKNDLPSLHRLKHLRHNLERARTLLELVRQREKKKREITAIFVEQRRLELNSNILTPVAAPKRLRVVMRSSPPADDFGAGVVASSSLYSSEPYNDVYRKRRKLSGPPVVSSVYKDTRSGPTPSQSPAPPRDPATSMASDTESDSDLSDHRPTPALSEWDRPNGPHPQNLLLASTSGGVGLSPVAAILSAPYSLPFTHAKDYWIETTNVPQSFGRVSHIRCRIGRGGRRIIDRRCIWRTISPSLEPEPLSHTANADVPTRNQSESFAVLQPIPINVPIDVEPFQQPQSTVSGDPSRALVPATRSLHALAAESVQQGTDGPGPCRSPSTPSLPPLSRAAVTSNFIAAPAHSSRPSPHSSTSSPPPRQPESPASVPSTSSTGEVRTDRTSRQESDSRVRSHADISRQSVSLTDKALSPRRYLNGVKLYSHCSTPHESPPAAGALPLPLPAKLPHASTPPLSTSQLSPVTNRCNWDASHPPSCTPPFRDSTPLV